jgi:hypothetical protein
MMRRVHGPAGWVALLSALLWLLGCSRKADDPTDAPAPIPTRNGPHAGFPGAPVSRPEGLLVNDARAGRGYTLLSPLQSDETTLIDTNGKTVWSWRCGCVPALGATLLENGNLLRAGKLPKDEHPVAESGGAGGRIQEFSWTGELVWDFRYADARHVQHHDALKLPNGNVLVLVCEWIPGAEAIAAGRRPDTFAGGHLWSDCVAEVKPTGPTAGEVVWVWRVWDHLIQEADRAKPNYGIVADHPELVDLNFGTGINGSHVVSGPDLAKLQGLGYIGTPPVDGPQDGALNGDWTHLNSVAYDPQRDQIAVTGLGFSEVWIIDHSTTRAEAAGHTGGRSGRGGDLLYRWGNPRAYRHGTSADRRLTGPHSAHWIGSGLPGAGHLLLFNNGSPRPEERASSVDELELPVDSAGRYVRPAGAAFGPEKPVWSHNGERKADFFSPVFSGAQRLPNGNTLACLGMSGTVVEVTPAGETVWKYAVPARQQGSRPAGALPRPVPPGGANRPGPPAGVDVLGVSLFRAPRYAPDYPGLVGKDLTPKSAP